jgi:hypothetical protein
VAFIGLTSTLSPIHRIAPLHRFVRDA